jgi:hypothetical protein
LHAAEAPGRWSEPARRGNDGAKRQPQFLWSVAASCSTPAALRMQTWVAGSATAASDLCSDAPIG